MTYRICEVTSYRSIRIHTVECRYQPTTGKYTRWDAFPTLRAAIEEAQRRGHPEARGCGICLDELGSIWKEPQPIPLATLLGRVPH